MAGQALRGGLKTRVTGALESLADRIRDPQRCPEPEDMYNVTASETKAPEIEGRRGT